MEGRRVGGTGVASSSVAPAAPGSFGDDVAFLRAHLPDLVVLERGSMRVAVAPSYQGRVMTSSAAGDEGASYGWIHRALIASGELTPHMNAFGGEDRFWLGPEGGQLGLYFPPGAPFEFERWQVPAPIDTEAWAVSERDDEAVTFTHAMELQNRAGTRFDIGVERRVRLLSGEAIREVANDPSVRAVGYESINTITNTGDEAWRPETGLVSIWILSMYRPSPESTVVIPVRTDGEGPLVNDAYFGAIPAERLRTDEAAGVVFFRADGAERGKIGIPPGRALPWLGAWDAARGALTLVRYTLPEHAPHGYVDSAWEERADPYGGDVANSYNDGPPAPGEAPLGPFYELESSSPAAALAPGERMSHTHTTLHLEGSREALDAIAREHLHVGLDAIEAAFAR